MPRLHEKTEGNFTTFSPEKKTYKGFICFILLVLRISERREDSENKSLKNVFEPRECFVDATYVT